MKGYMILEYIKYKFKTFILFSLYVLIFIVIFFLYEIELEAILYASILLGCLTVIVFPFSFINFYKKHKNLLILREQININLNAMPLPNHLIEIGYQNIIMELYNINKKIILDLDNRQSEMIDYYTLWAHQIKTPIAAMRLLIQSDQTEMTNELISQLVKIEQYVDMVLGFIRIDSPTSDLSLQVINLSDLVRQTVKKFAHLFISKKIAFEFIDEECMVLTDEKWLQFVLEQILSNSLKYTHQGKITISIQNDTKKVLLIEDTGIGIAEEDLPRVFEKGFTGYNGRMDKKATGIGLYLCKKVLNKLSHKISITSEVNVGTKVMIDLTSKKTIHE